MLEFILSTKILNNIEEAPFGILGERTEPNNYLKVEPTVEREIGFILEIDRYSCD